MESLISAKVLEAFQHSRVKREMGSVECDFAKRKVNISPEGSTQLLMLQYDNIPASVILGL